MSLDLTIIHRRRKEDILNEIKEARANNIRLESVEIDPTVWSENITHNLGKMAAEVPVKDGITLYNLLWHPREAGFTKVGKEYIDLVEIGYNYVQTHPELRKYNPENGWGDYGCFLDFVKDYNFLLHSLKDYDTSDYLIVADV